MTTRIHRLAAVAACAALAVSARAESARPANAVQSIDVAEKAGAVELRIRGTRPPSYTVFKLQDPPRLVIDLSGADVSAVAAPIPVGKAGVVQVTTAQYRDDRATTGRVIVGLEPSSDYEVAPRGEDLLVTVRPGPAPRATAAAVGGDNVVSRRVDEASVSHPASTLTAARAKGAGVALALDGEVARFEVIELANPPRLAIDLHGVTRAPRAPVALGGAFKQVRFGKDAGKVRVVLDADGELPACDVKRTAGGIVVVPQGAANALATAPDAAADRLTVPVVAVPPPVARPAATARAVEPAQSPVEPQPTVESSGAEAAGFTAEAPSYAAATAPQRREWVGRRITLDFHDIEIRNLLRLIADVSKKNIVVADDVNGKVTVSLRNIPWDQALDIVLKTKGLDKEETGNVIRVAKAEVIAKEQQARAEAAKARLPLLPLKVRLIPVNFARASEVSDRVKDVLSERGSVSTDDRTNVLIVKDIPEKIATAEALVRNLDTEIPQVRIESRIVEASSNFGRAIGVQWGGNASIGPATGNPTGLFFPNVIGATGQSDGLVTPNNWAVNLPAATGQGQGGALGLVLGSAGGAFNLNLRLSALENSGVVKTISAPSVSTVDNREATIGQGFSIPFSQVSQNGVNTVFVEAKLELKVTPHVSADGSILLKIKVTNNAPNPQLTGANGQPSISKREAETEALVRDGETTVIGGIYTRQTANRASSVPFLGKIPLLGYFFRTTANSDDHTELLIFITPRVITRQATAAAQTAPVEG